MKMSDLEAGLLEWASRQTAWQRDLLRRLAGGEILTAADYRAYADEARRIELSQDVAWFKEPVLRDSPNFVPLDSPHLASTVVGGDPVHVTRVVHLEGVNRLAAGAALEFEPTGLTIVAGSNGSGKSGYTRIFKQVAATRASENVLPNAFQPQITPKAVVTYQIGSGNSAIDLTWEGNGTKEESPMQRVRVFDSQSAVVHLASSAEVAYVPASLQILSAYTNALQEVASNIESDIQNERLQEQTWPELQSKEGAALFETLGTPESLKTLLEVEPLSDGEKKELDDIPRQIAELSLSDPAARAIQARQRAGQLTALITKLNTIALKLSSTGVEESKRIRNELAKTRFSVNQAQSKFDGTDVLPGTGSDAWQSMWSAALEFVEDGAHEHDLLRNLEQCPLCVQSLSADAKGRLELFAEFMSDEAQTAFVAAKELRDRDVQTLNALPFGQVKAQELVDLVGTYDEDASRSLLSLVDDATAWRDMLAADSNSDNVELPDVETLAENLANTIESLRKAAASEESAATALAQSDRSASTAENLASRRDALFLRSGIYSARDAIGAQHDRNTRIARLNAAKSTCTSNSASRKNSELSQGYIAKVCERFTTEANKLGLQRVPVELAFDRSSKGVSYVKVGLKGAPPIPVASVLSEGEQRITAIAGFFADLAESGDHSALVFDDPVSSLDQEFRVKVANRLLEEAEERQVIIFTHDFSFVQYLYEEKSLRDKIRLANGEKVSPDLEYRHIARTRAGAGSVTDAEVWRHVSVKERIGRLKSRHQAASTLYRSGDIIAYEKEARDIVGSLRETWEVFVEQDLLNGVVRRHERSVQTQRLAKLTDLSDTDIAVVDLGMAIESRYMTGHAMPISDGSPPQEPDWVIEEIRQLEDFRKLVLKRR